jgi:protein-S-isoprenylcysteine O-methyltransferase Ste14
VALIMTPVVLLLGLVVLPQQLSLLLAVAVLASTMIIWGIVARLAVRWDERNLETRFGEAYLHLFTTVSGDRRE